MPDQDQRTRVLHLAIESRDSMAAAARAEVMTSPSEREQYLRRAEQKAREAIRVSNAFGLNEHGTAVLVLGELALLDKRYREAEEFFGSCLELANRTRNRSLVRAARDRLGRLRWAGNDPVAALHHFSESIRLFEELQNNVKAEPHQIAFAEKESPPPYDEMLEIYTAAGDGHAVLETMERAKSCSFVSHLATGLPLATPDDPRLAGEAALLARLEVARSSVQNELAKSALEKAKAWRSLIEVQRELEEMWRSLEPVYPEYTAVRLGKHANADAVQTCLRAGGSGTSVAFIEYFVGERQTWGCLSKAGSAEPRVFETHLGERLLQDCARRLRFDFHGLDREDTDLLPLEREAQARALALEPAVPWFRRNKRMVETNLLKPIFAYDLTYWQKLGAQLLPAALRTELDGIDLLCIAPHGPLHALPFAALPWSGDQFLIERFGIVQVPSGSVLQYCELRRQRPGFCAAPVRAMLVCVGEATDQPDAKESDKATLASAEVGSYPFGGDATVLEGLLAPGAVELLCGVRGDANALPATKEFVRTTAPQQDILHFACHGMFRPEYGVPTAAVAMRPVKTSPLSKALASWRADALDSCLVLSSGRALFSSTAEAPTPDSERSDFLLKAREILDLKLSATLATLRACSSGRSDPKRGDEHLGLVRAFILAGCLSVLASLWDVNVRTSQKLLETFYRSWLGEERLPKWKALQRAQVEMLRGDHSHPYHWAPFILSGHWL